MGHGRAHSCGRSGTGRKRLSAGGRGTPAEARPGQVTLAVGYRRRDPASARPAPCGWLRQAPMSSFPITGQTGGGRGYPPGSRGGSRGPGGPVDVASEGRRRAIRSGVENRNVPLAGQLGWRQHVGYSRSNKWNLRNSSERSRPISPASSSHCREDLSEGAWTGSGGQIVNISLDLAISSLRRPGVAGDYDAAKGGLVVEVDP